MAGRTVDTKGRTKVVLSWLRENPAWGCAGAALLVRACFAALPLDRLDTLFFPDDTWYVLDIARGLASGAGPAPHGGPPTNGFHPLLALLQVPFFWFSSDPFLPARVTPLILGVADTANAGLMARLAARSAGTRAGWIAGLAWSVSPLALQHAMGGLETSLALLLALATVHAGLALRDDPSPRSAVFFGLACGGALLARIDLAFTIVIMSLWLLRQVGFRLLVLAGLSAVLLLSPWWFYELRVFGTIVPESGPGTRTQVLVHREFYLKPGFWLSWAAGYLSTGGFFDWHGLREYLARHQGLGQVLCAIGVALPAGLGLHGLRRGRHEGVALLALAGAATVAFYLTWVPAYWFFRRYFVLAEASAILGAAVFAAGGRPWRRGLVSAASFAGCCQVAGWLLFPDTRWDYGAHGAKGYLRPAKEVLALLPNGAVVGAFQTGALGFVSGLEPGRGIRVVNLDGVVNRSAQVAMRERRLLDYVRTSGIGWIADWSINFQVLEHASRAGRQRAALDVVGEASDQGTAVFVVTRIEWLDGPARRRP